MSAIFDILVELVRSLDYQNTCLIYVKRELRFIQRQRDVTLIRFIFFRDHKRHLQGLLQLENCNIIDDYYAETS